MNVHERKIHAARAAAAVTGEAVEPRGDALDGQAAKPRRTFAGILLTGLRLLAKTVVPLLILAGGYGGYNYFVATKPEAPRKPKLERAFNVRTATARVQTVRPTLEVFGTSIAGREVDIRALVAGRVVETSPSLRPGASVVAGTSLLKIDPLDYETQLAEAKAQLKEAQSKIAEFRASIASARASLAYARDQQALAERDVARAQPLVKRGVTSEKTVDDRKQVLLQRKQAADVLQNEIAVWEARIAQQEAVSQRLRAAIARAEQRLTETELTSPFDAYVDDVSAQVGRMLSVNDKVATLIDRDWVDVRFSLTDKQYGRIVSSGGDLVGRKVKVKWELGASTFAYDAVVERVGARIEAQSGGVVVYARVTDPLKPEPLRPGAFVSVEVPDATFDNVIMLPSTALYDGDTVFAVDENNRLDPRKVNVVGVRGNNLLFRGAVKDGETVLVSRISTPGQGVLVKQVEQQ